ncbi:hypothetical protein [Nocardia jejuensis]|uniref:hypothetical protein n=1 Tax=Nocardia jejuensis TaxID=328049 RepID=UPI00083152A8|nr:hypothetical protein [Nocardia jejuensis]
MGKRQPADQISPVRRRISSLAMAGALPIVAALASAGTAAAEPVSNDDSQSAVVDNQPATGGAQPGVVVDTPFGQFAVPVPQAIAEGARVYLDTAEVSAEASTVADSENPGEVAAPGVTRVGRNSLTGVRDIPNAALAPVDMDELHAPDPVAAPGVAPIAAPEGKLRFGYTQVDIPPWLPAEQAAEINAVSASAEAELARTLDSAGFEPSRSDHIAAETVGTAAVGAAVGVGVAAPVEGAALLMGGFVGALAGTPFAPFGWFFGPTIGATAGVTLVAVPAATLGAGIGAAVGAVNGFMAPATQGAPVSDSAPVDEVAPAAEVAITE